MVLCCFCLMPAWSCFRYLTLYTVPLSRLVIEAQSRCCTLTIESMHRGVRFLLCEIFNNTFPLLSVPLDVLIFVFYPTNSRHCPDQFCLLRLRWVRGVARIRDVDCTHLGFAPCLARTRCPKVGYVHPSKWPFWLCASVFQKMIAWWWWWLLLLL